MRSTKSNSSSMNGPEIHYIPPTSTHHLIKKYCKQNDPADNSRTATEGNVSVNNIFREDGEVIDHLGVLQSNHRPAGGMELYKKMEKIMKESGLKKMSKRSNKQFSLLNLNTGVSRRETKRSQFYRLTIFNERIKAIQEQIVEEKQPIVWKDEIYKSHQDYPPPTTRRCSRDRKTAPAKSDSSESQIARPQTSNMNNSKSGSQTKENRCLSMERWVAEQSKSYQDKMALLNEMNYNRPLLKTYGNRYFEHTLRNRFEDQLQMGSFVYQLDGQFSQTKVINRIKKQGPLLKQRSFMKLKGHAKIFDNTKL